MLIRGDERVPMPPRIFELLLALVENAGRLVSKQVLIDRVWEDSYVEEGNLNQTVSRLRRALGERPNENRFIETVPRVGYRFIADVEIVGDAPPSRPVKLLPKPIEEPAAETVDRSSFRWVVIAVLLLVMGFATAGVWYMFPRAEIASGNGIKKQTPVRLTTNPTREDGAMFTRDGEIRFLRWQSERPAMFLMSGDGSNQRPDTSITGLGTGLWSPDGKKVVFRKQGDDTESLFLANSDGSNEIKLPFFAWNINWAQDSSKFLYQSGKTDSDIYLYTLATGESSAVISRVGFDSDPTFSPDGKSLLYVSDRDGNAEIYFQDLDGSNFRRLTDHAAHDEFPTFSPDGTQIVFNSNREDENFDVWIMNSDGGGLRKITTWNSNEEIRPGCWSADGTQLVFMSDKDGKTNVYKMDIEPFAPEVLLSDNERSLRHPMYSPDGAKLLYIAEADDKAGELRIVDTKTKATRALLTVEESAAYPRFSPDGKWIVLQHRIAGNAEICVISVDGGDVRNLTNNPARDIQPSWSPDGSKIVFTSNREGNYDVFSIYTMNSDGSNVHRIYYSYAISSFPAWSPDGQTIVFGNDKEDSRTGNFELFSIEPETTNPERRLTVRRKYDIQPAFSPDGRRIAFASNTDGNYEIYVMNADGSAPVRITRDAAEDSAPAWSPDGKRIIFSSDRGGKLAIHEAAID